MDIKNNRMALLILKFKMSDTENLKKEFTYTASIRR